ncbi:MAG: class I SAM-dependent methyltransferase [Bdellovibrionales bacterium]
MNAEQKTYDESFFAAEGESSLRAARRIVPLVLHMVPAKSVLDVGCGVGMFLRGFSECGVGDVQGVDGDYVPAQYRQISPDRFKAHDLNTPFDLGRRYDLVVSLEVAEHLPAVSADNFVASLCTHGDVVLFSAAIPGQGGTNHVNEQWPDYWAAKFAAQGYSCIDVLRPLLWNDPEIDYWYRQNMLFFANAGGLAANPNLETVAASAIKWKSLNVVHPELYLVKQKVIGEWASAFARFKKQLEDFNKRG